MSADTLFNAYVSTSAVSAAADLGLLHAVHDAGSVDLVQFAERGGLHEPAVRAVSGILVGQGVLSSASDDPTVVTAGPEFEDFWRNQGFFLWLVRGYGDVLSRVSEATSAIPRGEVAGLRDGGAIARAGKEYGRAFVDPVVDDLVDGLDFTVMADLGCGSANRLIRLAQRHPDKHFIGVEIDGGAQQVARAAVGAAGLSERILIVRDDARHLSDRPEYADVDAIASFFLAHDLWPRQSCLDSLERVRERMPKARHFLLCDTYRSPERLQSEAPIFTMAFEFTHDLMGHHVPTLDEWLDLFEESVWTLASRAKLQLAYSEVFHLTSTGD